MSSSNSEEKRYGQHIGDVDFCDDIRRLRTTSMPETKDVKDKDTRIRSSSMAMGKHHKEPQAQLP